MRHSRIEQRGSTVGQLSDSGKSAFTDAHQRPLRPSMHPEPAERAEAGAIELRRADPSGQQTVDPKTAVKTMGISVALDGDARQAAAAKLAEEQALVRNAQAGDRLAFEELGDRYDREA